MAPPHPGFSRRRFLQGAGAAPAFPTIIPARVLGANAPSQRNTVGFIGTGGHGIERNLKMFLRQPDARAVAVCDVFKSRMEKAKQLVDANDAEANASASRSRPLRAPRSLEHS